MSSRPSGDRRRDRGKVGGSIDFGAFSCDNTHRQRIGGSILEVSQLAARFPAYFQNFKLPDAAREQCIDVYRACRTHKVERASFLNTYEENGFAVSVGKRADDPQEYCLSTYWRLRDIHRFVAIDAKFSPPHTLARGHTHPSCGLSCKSKEWKRCRNSHVDWWLYEGAEPWKHFEEVSYEEERAAFPERW